MPNGINFGASDTRGSLNKREKSFRNFDMCKMSYRTPRALSCPAIPKGVILIVPRFGSAAIRSVAGIL